MTVIVFVDNNGGMMFNHRRQSQDKVALRRIVAMSADSALWVNEYSTSLFADCEAPRLHVDAHFLDKAGPGEFCLVEDADILPFSCFIEKIILFHWNRVYPADQHFPIDVHGGKWRCIRQEEFAGSSHDKITMEVYVR